MKLPDLPLLAATDTKSSPAMPDGTPAGGRARPEDARLWSALAEFLGGDASSAMPSPVGAAQRVHAPRPILQRNGFTLLSGETGEANDLFAPEMGAGGLSLQPATPDPVISIPALPESGPAILQAVARQAQRRNEPISYFTSPGAQVLQDQSPTPPEAAPGGGSEAAASDADLSPDSSSSTWRAMFQLQPSPMPEGADVRPHGATGLAGSHPVRASMLPAGVLTEGARPEGAADSAFSLAVGPPRIPEGRIPKGEGSKLSPSVRLRHSGEVVPRAETVSLSAASTVIFHGSASGPVRLNSSTSSITQAGAASPDLASAPVEDTPVENREPVVIPEVPTPPRQEVAFGVRLQSSGPVRTPPGELHAPAPKAHLDPAEEPPGDPDSGGQPSQSGPGTRDAFQRLASEPSGESAPGVTAASPAAPQGPMPHATTTPAQPVFPPLPRSSPSTSALREDTAPVARAISAAPLRPAVDEGAPQPVRELSLRISDGTSRAADVRIVDRAGEVRVSVRSADPELTANLRDGLSGLASQLDRHPVTSEIWRPAVADSKAGENQSQNQGEGRGEPHQSHNGESHTGAGGGQTPGRRQPPTPDWEESESGSGILHVRQVRK